MMITESSSSNISEVSATSADSSFTTNMSSVFSSSDSSGTISAASTTTSQNLGKNELVDTEYASVVTADNGSKGFESGGDYEGCVDQDMLVDGYNTAQQIAFNKDSTRVFNDDG